MGQFDTRAMYGEGRAIIDGQAPTADVELVAATTGFRVVVDYVLITVGTAAATLFFESGTTTKVSPTFHVGINGALEINEPRFVTAGGEALTFTSVGVNSVTAVYVRYHKEPTAQ